MRVRSIVCLTTVALLALAPIACSRGSKRVVATSAVVITGRSAADFIALATYLNDPTVADLLTLVPRRAGSTPPNVSGTYAETGTVSASSVPGVSAGDATATDFCLGAPAGSAIEATVLDATIVDGGALSFIEGSGNDFTVYTAFKSVQTGPSGGVCEIHQVLVVSGRREANGSLSSLSLGFAIVGIVGDCGALLPGQIQASSGSAARTGASCVGGSTPVDPTAVLVFVDNFLLSDADLFVDGAFIGTVPLLSSVELEVDPGFTLSFESVPPQNALGEELGEILAGAFPQDTQPVGRASAYSLGNQVGDDIYFAPLIWNQTTTTLTASVNVGTVVESGCNCQLASSSLAQYTLGYHFYDAPGLITASQANVRLDDETPATNPAEFFFQGPFTLGLDSGALSLFVP